jgi:lipid-A-disaccharide synthase
MIVAGEASGDKHGAHLVAELRALRPDWEFFGAGGDEMRAAGVETIVDAREMAIMGAFEVAAALPRFLAAFRHLRDAARERAARATILIDWPEFNLRLAKRLRRDGHRVFYYISPQVWAWRGYRVGAIRRDIERMLVILPFERDFYARSGVEVDYVGHPLLDSVRVGSSRAEFCARHLLRAEAPLVALLPGSRRSELKYILPPLLEAARQMAAGDPSLQFVLPLAPAILPAQIRTDFDPPPSVHLVAGETYDAIAAADLAVVASGTATLETALIGTPLIVVYRASALNWRLFRPLISVSQVGLPNLIAGREIVPELLQDELNAARLAPLITALLGDPARLARQREDLAAVRARLGRPHASQRAAQRLVALIEADERRT